MTFSYETSNDVVDFLKRNSLISLAQDKDLEKNARKQKLTKLDLVLKMFPDNEEKIIGVIKKIYNLENNIYDLKEKDLLFSLSEFILLKKESGDLQILTSDPQLVTDYFNYLLPNTCVLNREKIQALLDQKLPKALQEDINLLVVQSEDIEIKEITEVVKKTEAEEEISEDAVKQLDKIVRQAIQKDISDIHIEVDTDESDVPFYAVRFRQDGVLNEFLRSNNLEVYLGILSQIKLKAGLKLDENRLPQDGRMSYSIFGSVHSFRVSTKPVMISDLKKGGEATAEKIVIRKMPDVNNINLDKLGYNSYAVQQIKESTTLANGFNIITGPTGSGKTTLLYAILANIDTNSKNVSTIEDPVEAEIKQVNQTQVLSDIGLTFSRVLRAELRQDPDIIMVGEMRDTETAEIAAEASLTGHLVFSTLHTKNAVSTITRLINMGVPPFIVSSAISYSIAQRLVRRLCVKCKEKVDNFAVIEKEVLQPVLKKIKNKEVKKALQEAIKNQDLYKENKKGCRACSNMGYTGRAAIVEVFKIPEECEEIILQKEANEQLMQDLAERTGMMPMEVDGLITALSGKTSINEVYSVLVTE